MQESSCPKKTDAIKIEAFHIEDGYFLWDGVEFGMSLIRSLEMVRMTFPSIETCHFFLRSNSKDGPSKVDGECGMHVIG